MKDYQPPVSKLLEIGDKGADLLDDYEWDYVGEYGLTQDDIPALIEMVLDEDLLLNGEDIDKYSATTHAMKALAQLQATQAIDPLIALGQDLDKRGLLYNAMYFQDHFGPVIGKIGPAALPGLKKALAESDGSESDKFQVELAQALTTVPKEHPEARDEVVAIAIEQLQNYNQNTYGANAELIRGLATLGATEAMPLIEEAYKADRVDEFFYPRERARADMKGEKIEPMVGPIAGLADAIADISDEPSSESSGRSSTNKNKKKKRKMAKQSRKQNRKR